MKSLEILKQLDAYPRLLESYGSGTLTGAAVTILTATLITTLVSLEVIGYFQLDVAEELFVDTTRGQKLKINLDFTVSRISCDYLSLDAMDSTGDRHLHINHNIYKRKLDLNGNTLKDEPVKQEITTAPAKSQANVTAVTCGSCYGAASGCCNTCEEVMAAYREKRWEPNPDNFDQCKEKRLLKKASELRALKEGCQIYGEIEVNRVGGVFHIAPGRSFSLDHIHIHDVQPYSSSDFNLTHTINHLSFGDRLEIAQTHPLDHKEIVSTEGATMYQYYVKIVPTMYLKRNGEKMFTNQFSATISKKVFSLLDGDRGMPGIFVTYELSPLMVKYTEKSRSLDHVATNICSIIGGVFTVAGIFVSLVQHSINVLREKLQLGKLS